MKFENLAIGAWFMFTGSAAAQGDRDVFIKVRGSAPGAEPGAVIIRCERHPSMQGQRTALTCNGHGVRPVSTMEVGCD